MEESQNIDFKGISLHMKKEMSRIRMLRMNVRGIFFLLGVPVGRSGFTFQVLA